VVDRIGGGHDLGPLATTVAIRSDSYRPHGLKFTDDVFDRRQVFTGKAAMRNDHDSDHAMNLEF
jgi:hypothetical protein